MRFHGPTGTSGSLCAAARGWTSTRRPSTRSPRSRRTKKDKEDGAFDPEGIFFVGTQAARLGMPEATEILDRGVDAGYPCWEALVRHPWITPIKEQPGFADLVRRAEEARRRAEAAFREAGGPALLGLS